MSATRILWGQILVVFALTLAGVWAGTQWTAHALGGSWRRVVPAAGLSARPRPSSLAYNRVTRGLCFARSDICNVWASGCDGSCDYSAVYFVRVMESSYFSLQFSVFDEESSASSIRLVVDVEEGTGRNVGRLGAIIVEGEDDGYTYHLNCGSGFTDSQRDQFWADRDNLIDSLVEIRADARTKSQDSDTYSLRFPRFKTFRNFSNGEKV